MPIVTRPVNYTGGRQQLQITPEIAGIFDVHLWGGGGGGGGNDSRSGGNGSGGGYSKVVVSAVPGDIIYVAIGGGGGLGRSYTRYVEGGPGGYSWLPSDTLNMRVNTPINKPKPQSVSYPEYWLPWMNENAVTMTNGPYDYTVNFSYTGNYVLQYGADYGSNIYLDGALIASSSGYQGSWTEPSPIETTFFVTAGVHTITVAGINDGGTEGIACNIFPGSYPGFGGGNGGIPGYGGASGAGGGGGGATVVWKNDTIIAVAAGGGGGGGGGQYSAGENAPGGRGTAPSPNNSGQNGQNKEGDGGSGGGGGGGWGGGSGGLQGNGDGGGGAGANGGNYGPTAYASTGRNPAQANNEYRFGNAGLGGLGGLSGSGTSGAAGQATFVFNLSGCYVKNSNTWLGIQKTFVKDNNIWMPVKNVYVRQNNQWVMTLGSNPTAPTLTAAPGIYGTAPRPFS